jgi:hypothetical protein
MRYQPWPEDWRDSAQVFLFVFLIVIPIVSLVVFIVWAMTSDDFGSIPAP